MIPFLRTQNTPDSSTFFKSDLLAISIPKKEGFGVEVGKVFVGNLAVGGGKVIVGKAEFGGDNVFVGKEGLISIRLVDDSPRTVGVDNLVAISDGAIVAVSDDSILFVGCGEVGVRVDCDFDWKMHAAVDNNKITIINDKNIILRLY